MKKKRGIDPVHEASEWNKHVKVGDEVEYREVVELDPPQLFTTRSEACVLSGHTAVVWLHGKAGCVAISHCRPLTASAQGVTR